MTIKFRIDEKVGSPPPGPGRSYRDYSEDCAAELDALRAREHNERLAARGFRRDPTVPACPGTAPWPDADRVRAAVQPYVFAMWMSSIHVHPDGSLGGHPQKVGWINDRFGRLVGAEVAACGDSA